jgi:hypothetical protein
LSRGEFSLLSRADPSGGLLNQNHTSLALYGTNAKNLLKPLLSFLSNRDSAGAVDPSDPAAASSLAVNARPSMSASSMLARPGLPISAPISASLL